MRDYTSFSGVEAQKDEWTYGNIAFYAPPGEVSQENAEQWIAWFVRADQLYEEISLQSPSNFDNIYRTTDPYFGRKKVMGIAPSFGLGCGNKGKAEVDPGLLPAMLENPNDYEPHWTFFYEMARGGAAEPFYGRAMWPANTVIMPHLMAGITFHDLAGEAGIRRGIPGNLVEGIEAWEAADLKWADVFTETDQTSQNGWTSDGLAAGMLYKILIDHDRETVRAVLENMAAKPETTTPEQAMCNFKDAVNQATDNQYAGRMVYDWGLPESCGWELPATPQPSPTAPAPSGQSLIVDQFTSTIGTSLASNSLGTGWNGGWAVTQNDVSQIIADNIEYGQLNSAGNQTLKRRR